MAPTVTGAWRDRTNLYISYRQSYAHHPAKRTKFSGPRYTDDDTERAGLMSSQDNDTADAIIEMDVLPPRWLDIQDDVQRHLADIAPKMKRLEQLHNKHVLPGFDDESVKAAEEREIEAMTQDITRDFSSCQRAIKRIDVMVREQQQASGQISSADETMAKNLKRSLAARVGDVSTSFRKKQSAYMKKLRTLGGMPGLSSPADRSGTPLGQNTYNAAMMESETDRSTAQSTLLQTAQVRRRENGVVDRAIQQREAEIEKIAQGVIDLSNLFQDLQTMVIDQGTVLDRIDYNVERTAEHVQTADKELKVATGYQKRSMRRKIIFLLILIVFGMLVLLLIKPRRGSSGGGAPPTPPPKSDPLPNVPLQGSEGGSDFFPPRRLVRRDLLYYDFLLPS
jgi:syntaxin 16